jgi:ribosomal protein S24E
MNYTIRKIKSYISRLSAYKSHNKYSKYEYLYENHKNLNIYENLFKNLLGTPSSESQRLISFSKYFSFNDSKAKIKKKLGQPTFQILNTKNKDIDIFFYKIQVGNEKIKCEVHFYNNTLFLFKYEQPYIKKKESKMMFSILQKNYGFKDSNQLPEKIIDINDNALIVSNHIGVTLSYVYTSHPFFDLLEHQISEKKLYKEQCNVRLKKFYNSL